MSVSRSTVARASLVGTRRDSNLFTMKAYAGPVMTRIRRECSVCISGPRERAAHYQTAAIRRYKAASALFTRPPRDRVGETSLRTARGCSVRSMNLQTYKCLQVLSHFYHYFVMKRNFEPNQTRS